MCNKTYINPHKTQNPQQPIYLYLFITLTDVSSGPLTTSHILNVYAQVYYAQVYIYIYIYIYRLYSILLFSVSIITGMVIQNPIISLFQIIYYTKVLSKQTFHLPIMICIFSKTYLQIIFYKFSFNFNILNKTQPLIINLYFQIIKIIFTYLYIARQLKLVINRLYT